MHVERAALVVCILFLAIPSFGKQPPQNASTPHQASDTQAVAIVQAAITTLGGPTAIGQSVGWDLQGQQDGPVDIGDKSETVKRQITNNMIVANGVSRPAPRFVNSSLFLPVLVGAVLLQESQDSNFVMRLDGPSTLASKVVIGVTFLAASTQSVVQTWLFDPVTGLPVRVFFELPAQVGLTKSFRGLVDLSNYNLVSGVLYPFSVITYTESAPPETLTLQSVIPDVSTAPSQAGATTGGVQ